MECDINQLTCEICGNKEARKYEWMRPIIFGGLYVFVVCPECQKEIDTKIDQLNRQAKLILTDQMESWLRTRQRHWRAANRQLELSNG